VVELAQLALEADDVDVAVLIDGDVELLRLKGIAGGDGGRGGVLDGWRTTRRWR